MEPIIDVTYTCGLSIYVIGVILICVDKWFLGARDSAALSLGSLGFLFGLLIIAANIALRLILWVFSALA